MENDRYQKGFSLVELIIVIAIMAILAGAVAPALIRYIDKGRRSSDVTTARTIYDETNYLLSSEFDHYETWCDINYPSTRSPRIYTVPGNGSTGGTGYTVELIMSTPASANGTFTAASTQLQDLSNDMMKQFGQTANGGAANGKKVRIRYTKDSGQGKAREWGVCRNTYNNAIEVWLCDDQGAPIYRLNPDCCKEYN